MQNLRFYYRQQDLPGQRPGMPWPAAIYAIIAVTVYSSRLMLDTYGELVIFLLFTPFLAVRLPF